MTTKFTPIGDKILVQPNAQPKMTAGGLYIPETAKGRDDRAIRGKVIAVGPGRVRDDGEVVEVCVEPGDEVIFLADRIQIEFDGETYFVVQERDLLGVVVE